MKENLVMKRIGAYIIDLFVIMLFVMVLPVMKFINPKYDEYSKYNEQYEEVLNRYMNNEINQEEFTNETKDIAYSLNKSGYVYIIGNIIIVFLYYGGFVTITKGQTLGKKLMGIKIVSNKEDRELKPIHYFLRAFILNGVIMYIVTLIALCFNKDTYFMIYQIASICNQTLLLVIFAMILFNKDNRGLHDIIAGTKVVSVRDNEVLKKNENS